MPRSRLVALALVTVAVVAVQVVANKDDRNAPLALTGLDPVSLTQGKKVEGKPTITLARQGFRYQFADEPSKAAFEKDPARYEIQLKGRCPAMPHATGDPELFAVHKERIYIFGSAACRVAFLADPDKALALKRKNVAIFVHEGVELLDFAGPGEVFAAAKRGRAFHVYTVATSTAPITSQGFLKVTPEYTLDSCPKPDILVIPGGATALPLKDEKVIAWIRKASADAEVSLSVCTGSFLFAKAGLLDDKEATTHWASIDRLKKAAPKTKVHADRRIVDNGKVVTTAGVSAGIDGSLHVVGRLLGKEAARETARYMEYHWDEGKK